MFVFLTRLGRLFVATVVLAGVISILGVMSITGVLVSHHSGATSSMACAVSSTGVGQQLVVSGRGFAPGTQYHLFVNTPTASFETVANTDSTGTFSYDNWAYSKGSYGASVWSEGGGSKQMAACTSLTL